MSASSGGQSSSVSVGLHAQTAPAGDEWPGPDGQDVHVRPMVGIPRAAADLVGAREVEDLDVVEEEDAHDRAGRRGGRPRAGLVVGELARSWGQYVGSQAHG